MAHQSSSPDLPLHNVQPQPSRIRQGDDGGVADHQIEVDTTNVRGINPDKKAMRHWIATRSYFLLSVVEVIVLGRLLFRLRDLMKMGSAWRNP